MAKNLKKIIGLRIRLARQQKGLTQEQLAEKLDKAVETVSNFERGVTSPSIETLADFTHALGVPLQSMFEGYEILPKRVQHRTGVELKILGVLANLSEKDLLVTLDLAQSLAKHHGR